MDKKWKPLVFILSATGILVFAFILSAVTQTRTTAAYAQELVEKGIDPDSILKLAEVDEAIYYETTTYHRSDSTVAEPPDPYHLPVLPFYHGEEITAHWITREGYAQATFLATNRERLLTKSVGKPDGHAFYNAITDMVMMVPAAANEDRGLPEHEAGQIDGTTISPWGREAWVIKFEPRPASPDEYGLQAQKLVYQSQVPFAADLAFTEVQWVWEIDQETELLVSQKLMALTSPEPTVLYLEVRSEPEVLPISDLPAGWDELPAAADAALAESQSEGEIATVDGVPQAPADVAQLFDFPIYLPNMGIATGLEDLLDKVYVFQNSSSSNTPPSLAFEATQIGESEFGMKVIYLSSMPTDPERPQAIVLAQAPRSEAVAKLQQSLPVWQMSRPITVTLDGETANGWLVWGGVMRQADNNPLIGLIAEKDETLIYLEGQNVSEEILIAFLASLQVVNQ